MYTHTMAVEQAQHLIAMSLGKIAASRNQRGGANLHRSLLVSTVLHKARTTIMMENFQAMMQQRRAQMEAQQQRVDVMDERPATPVPTSMPLGDRWNKENSPPPTPVSTPTADEPCDRLTDVSAKEQQENNNCALSTSTEHSNSSNTSTSERPSPLQESNSENVSPNCAKCLKRRVTELGPCDDDYSSSKRTKFESDSELSHDTISRSDCAFESENVDYSSSHSQSPEPMQTDPVQITNLVHRFNSGLSGLLTQVQVAATEQHGQCSEQTFTSCCTQVKDSGIESLSRPCIALTV